METTAPITTPITGLHSDHTDKKRITEKKGKRKLSKSGKKETEAEERSLVTLRNSLYDWGLIFNLRRKLCNIWSKFCSRKAVLASSETPTNETQPRNTRLLKKKEFGHSSTFLIEVSFSKRCPLVYNLDSNPSQKYITPTKDTEKEEERKLAETDFISKLVETKKLGHSSPWT